MGKLDSIENEFPQQPTDVELVDDETVYWSRSVKNELGEYLTLTTRQTVLFYTFSFVIREKRFEVFLTFQKTNDEFILKYKDLFSSEIDFYNKQHRYSKTEAQVQLKNMRGYMEMSGEYGNIEFEIVDYFINHFFEE